MNNVLENQVATLRRWSRLVVKRRWLALGVGSATALVCGLGVTAFPDRYQASARVYVDTQTVLKPLMASLTYQPDIDQQVGMLARTLISRPNVEQLVRRPELRIDTSNPKELEAVVTRLMKRIQVTPTASGNLYEITYRGTSTDSAQRMVEATVNMFVSTGAGAKKRDSQDAGRFIEAQIGTYEAKLIDVENRLKEFRIRNFGVSGVSNQDYFSRISVLTEQVNKLSAELLAAERSRDSYRGELALEDPLLPTDGALARTGPVLSDLDLRLEAQRKHLDELRSRYTDEHPDVIAARNVIARLETESREARAMRALTPDKVSKAATSPVYQQLRIALAEAEARVASLESQLTTQRKQLDEVRSLAGRLPQVEAEYAQLNRDYEIIRKTYDSMVARRESAALGVKLDESSQLAEFRVVEPPRVSQSPVFPARVHLAALAIVASIAVGIAAALMPEFMSPTLSDASALRQLCGRPVLGTVSMLVTPAGRLARRKSHLRFAIACASAFMLQTTWVGWIALTTPYLQ